MIKLTNKMRDCLMISGRYEAARWTYYYDASLCIVIRCLKNDLTPVEVLHIDLMKKGVKA